MELHALFLIVLSGFVLLQWFILPRVEAAWLANRTIGKVAKAGAVAALPSARTALQVATIVYGTLLVATWMLDAFGEPITVAGLRSKIFFLEILQKPLTTIKDSIVANISFWSALLGLAYLLYKRHYVDLTMQVAARAQSEIERLKTELERGTWIDVPPNQDMTVVVELIGKARSYAAKADGDESARAAAAVETLERQLVEMDFYRRMNLAEPPPQQESLRKRLWPSLLAVLTSRGFNRDTGLLAKACSIAGLGITCLSLVGIAGSTLDSNVGSRIAHAWDLVVEVSQNEAKASWNKALKENEKLSDNSSTSDTSKHIRALSHAFAHAYLMSPAWRTTAEGVRREYLIDAATAREHIVQAEGAQKHIAVRSAEEPKSYLLPPDDPTHESSLPTKLEQRLATRLATDTSGKAAGIWERLGPKLTAFSGAYTEPAKASSLRNL